MNRNDYLRMLDSGADSQDIAKELRIREETPQISLNWKENEHLQTDFVSRPAMDVRIESDVVDRPYSQRMYGTPVYDQNGDMHCRCCGEVISRTVSARGEGIAVCSNVGCQANGFAYCEGSFTHNPHRVRS